MSAAADDADEDEPNIARPKSGAGLAEAAVPHFVGHRERLRERFRQAGGEALPDYELLELVLFRAVPRADVKPLAKQLIQHFGSFAEVVSAPPKRGVNLESGSDIRKLDDVGRASTACGVWLLSRKTSEARCTSRQFDSLRKSTTPVPTTAAAITSPMSGSTRKSSRARIIDPISTMSGNCGIRRNQSRMLADASGGVSLFAI